VGRQQTTIGLSVAHDNVNIFIALQDSVKHSLMPLALSPFIEVEPDS